jgi:hypothetical protein
MSRDGYPSIFLVAAPQLEALAAALAESLHAPLACVTLYHWASPHATADPFCVDFGPGFAGDAPFVRAHVVPHVAGEAAMHVDVDYELPSKPPLLPAFAAGLARALDAPTIYDAARLDPFAYRRVWPDGRDEPVSLEELDGGGITIRPDPS